jgi:hypothetical protein
LTSGCHICGSIILIASVAGSKGFEGGSVYSVTKAAIRSFARSCTVDLKNRKIRVNAISPGLIETHKSAELNEHVKTIEITSVGYVYFLLVFAFTFTFPTFLDRCLLGTLALPVAFAPPPTILNIFPPHTLHIPDMPPRPSFALIRFSSFISRLTLHFAQYPSVVNLS